MDVLARFEVEVCALCGRQRQYGMTASCRGGIGRQRHGRRLYEKVEYVPADVSRGAVRALELLLPWADGPDEDWMSADDIARRAVALRMARDITSGGQ